MRNTKNILVILLLTFFVMHGVQLASGFIKVKPLNGVFNKTEIPQLNYNTWFTNAFQDSLNDRLDEIFGFRPLYIRLFNQVDFSLFGRTHPEFVILGKDNFLFEKWFLNEYLGFYYVGQNKATAIIEKLKFINNYLKQYNTELITVITPGKPYYYPEFMPPELERLRDSTNYQLYESRLNNTELTFLDINRWFVGIKDSTPYPLFTKTGTHWSQYSASLVADSIISLVEEKLQRPMNHIKILSVEDKSDKKTTDTDLNDLLNLFFPIPELPLGYPIVEFDTIVEKNKRPNRIVIADSFFWNLFDLERENSYKSTKLWYYYSSVYPQWEGYQPMVKDVDVLQKLKETDIVMVMVTTAGLHKFGYGFMEDVYDKINLEILASMEGSTEDFDIEEK